ncbi:hypothetical protein Hanom_Chr04g00336131 [Helianthus anomalus]
MQYRLNIYGNFWFAGKVLQREIDLSVNVQEMMVYEQAFSVAQQQPFFLFIFFMILFTFYCV